jgi:hypothetical protein
VSLIAAWLGLRDRDRWRDELRRQEWRDDDNWPAPRQNIASQAHRLDNLDTSNRLPAPRGKALRDQ